MSAKRTTKRCPNSRERSSSEPIAFRMRDRETNADRERGGLFTAANKYYPSRGTAAKPTQLWETTIDSTSSNLILDPSEMCACRAQGSCLMFSPSLPPPAPRYSPVHPLTRVDRAHCIVRRFYRNVEDKDKKRGERWNGRRGKDAQSRIGNQDPLQGARAFGCAPKKARPCEVHLRRGCLSM